MIPRNDKKNAIVEVNDLDVNLDEDVIATFELGDIADLLPKNPGREKIETMLEAALTGAEYSDSDSSGEKETEDKDETKAVKETKVVKETTVVEETEADSEVEDEADDILAQIRLRKKAKAG